MDKPTSPSSERNREPILAVLRDQFADRRRVLEIGSGTGQHAVHFAAAMPQLCWQTSDRSENLPGIRAWLEDAALPNTPAPCELDVSGAWPAMRFDAVFSANTLHIMAWHEVQQLFSRLPAVTEPGARLLIYGPFNYQGRYSSNSNAAFDQWLKARGEHMAIRDAEAVDALAIDAGFMLIEDIAMPANNRCRVWRRQTGRQDGHERMTSIDARTASCPCGNSASYTQCCGPLHDGAAANSAEQLMRSRYSAYVLQREDYLLASWHASMRPDSLQLATQQPAPTWLGLQIRRHDIHDDGHASVEFVARYRLGGGRAQRQHETSRFVREHGRWYYVDGALKA